MVVWATVTPLEASLTWSQKDSPYLWDTPIRAYGGDAYGNGSYGQCIKHPDNDLIIKNAYGGTVYGCDIYGQNISRYGAWKIRLFYGFGQYGNIPYGEGPYNENAYNNIYGVESEG